LGALVEVALQELREASLRRFSTFIEHKGEGFRHNAYLEVCFFTWRWLAVWLWDQRNR
jgi:hypothetical protein